MTPDIPYFSNGSTENGRRHDFGEELNSREIELVLPSSVEIKRKILNLSSRSLGRNIDQPQITEFVDKVVTIKSISYKRSELIELAGNRLTHDQLPIIPSSITTANNEDHVMVPIGKFEPEVLIYANGGIVKGLAVVDRNTQEIVKEQMFEMPFTGLGINIWNLHNLDTSRDISSRQFRVEAALDILHAMSHVTFNNLTKQTELAPTSQKVVNDAIVEILK